MQGKAAKLAIRIDVLIIPAWRASEVNRLVHPDIKIFTWEEIDNAKLINSRFGRLADLWLGQSIIPWSTLSFDDRNYIAYRHGERSSATWRYLWRALGYIRNHLTGLIIFEKIAGNRNMAAFDHDGVWPASLHQPDPSEHFRGDSKPVIFEHCKSSATLNLDAFCSKLRTGISRIRYRGQLRH